MPPADPLWAPLEWSFAGLWEIEPLALHELDRPVQLLDVREAAEYDGALGHLDGARLLPLGALAARQDELRRDRPVVTVCRSGTRSARAALMLSQAGFEEVANLAGGMLRWRAEQLPVVGGEA
jgi:rhodanese-related sulfurtransferase